MKKDIKERRANHGKPEGRASGRGSRKHKCPGEELSLWWSRTTGSPSWSGGNGRKRKSEIQVEICHGEHVPSCFEGG